MSEAAGPGAAARDGPGMPDAPSPWAEAVQAAALLAVDPLGLGGAALRAMPGPVREAWLALLRGLLPEGAPWRRLPLSVEDGRLLGGLDLAATLRAGRPVAERGLLAEADGGVLLLAMAERVAPGTAAHLAAAMDSGEVVAERDGLALRAPARWAVVALDEGLAPEEAPPAALLERLAFRLDLHRIAPREVPGTVAIEAPGPAAIAAARARLPGIAAPDGVTEALCATALALGIGSLRAPVLALRAARAAAALAGREAVTEADAALAARLVLAPRATRLPAPETDDPPPPEPEAEERPKDSPPPGEEDLPDPQALQDMLLAAAAAAVPPNLLDGLALAEVSRARAPGKAGAEKGSPLRGRPIGVRAGEPRGGARLALVETLRAAAPWQRLRGRSGSRIEIRRDDLRIRRFRQRSETATIFAVDASGSAALHRLAEAKGAVELLLADCYVRRDKVALLAFRGRGAELLLPPTGSLVRARRSLAGLPGGGGTPVAAALDAALALADSVRRKGQTPLLVVLTDGRANVARDGAGGRARAEAEALQAARALRAARIAGVLVDVSPRPAEAGRRLAAEMGAKYLALPYADAVTLSRAVRAEAA
ncbi:magnesium chelatase subunit D [Paracraurococcus lichenis]|uniref:Magnesium chelatase subunit D n=1 Tax=Paracraurococcus lichenis TaxID=3064888 RepID=A0ABT9DU96_9PROT|nr:magnesium chelatase subunit D [Paracraurococcus sp. LOR1-02]MDO9707467.1 magnesium chelatase subunit D [Paracraurococcus sp. LOR1-02]